MTQPRKHYDVVSNGQLIGRQDLIGDWLDDVGDFFTDDIPKFLKDNKDDIEKVGAVIATAAGTAIAGPAGGAAAGGLAKAGMQAAYGDTADAKKTAHAVIDAAKKEAMTKPAVAKVLTVANDALSKAMAGMATAHAVQAATRGTSQTAVAKLQALGNAAAAGNPVAIQGAQVAQAMANQLAVNNAKQSKTVTYATLGGLGALGLILALA